MVIEQLDPAYTHTAIAVINDVLHLKGLVAGTVQENWVKVEISIDRGTHYEYTCTRLSGAPHAFPIGTTFVNYGASGEGVVRFDSEDTHQPFIEVLTHSGAPYTTVVRHSVMGNLEAFTSVDEWGLVVGTDLDTFADDYLVLSDGRFELHRDLDVTTTKGFQFADGGIAGWVLTDDGTGLFVPAASAGGVLPVPTGQGYILRSNAVPAFVEYYAATLGAVLIGDGVDITSDTTPTFVDTVTLDDGASHSPNLRFVGGSNDDTAHIQLIDDAVAGNSDLTIILAADDADSQFMIRNASGVTKAWIDAVGDASFKNITATDGNIEITDDGGTYGTYQSFVYGSDALDYPRWRGRRARGTRAVPTTVQGGDVLGRFGAGGHDGAAFVVGSTGLMQVEATQVWTGTDKGTEVVFYTTPDDSDTAALMLTLQEDGIAHFHNSLRLEMDDTGVTDAGPTDAELDGIFGTPATVGDGFLAFVDDGGTHARIFGCLSDGTNWWWQRWFIAV